MDDVVNTCEIEDADDNTQTTEQSKDLTPLELIARLSSQGEIGVDQRDAAEIVARLAGFVYSRPAADGAAHIPLRDAEGKWSSPLLRGQEIKAKLEAALAAPKTASRQRAVTLALVSRDRTATWDDTSALSCGLEDVANHLWPRAAVATTRRNGVTLVKTSADDCPQDATQERLDKAGNDHALGNDGVRRIIDSPFARMHARGQLDPDAGINDILFSAGRNYYQNWFYGGLAGIGGIDYSRLGGGGDGDPAYMMPRSEFALGHRLNFRNAQKALGDRYRIVVDPVILEEGTVSETADQFTGTAPAIKAIAKERLNVGLRRLAVFYGLMRPASEAA